jgi:hypothetical protein
MLFELIADTTLMNSDTINEHKKKHHRHKSGDKMKTTIDDEHNDSDHESTVSTNDVGMFCIWFWFVIKLWNVYLFTEDTDTAHIDADYLQQLKEHHLSVNALDEMNAEVDNEIGLFCLFIFN